MAHTPAYRRIVNDITARIDSGVLRYGDRLPSGRQLQRQYGVSAQPVKSASLILEARGYTVGQQGRGVFVVAGAPARPAGLALIGTIGKSADLTGAGVGGALRNR
jgi:DNA-binding GntR family transcriptional regulator